MPIWEPPAIPGRVVERKMVYKGLKYSKKGNYEVSKYSNKDRQQLQKSNVYISNRVSEKETMNYDLETAIGSKVDTSKTQSMKDVRMKTYTLWEDCRNHFPQGKYFWDTLFWKRKKLNKLQIKTTSP